ncbi:MAG: ethanolamine utilization protein EutJ [Deltaproteobacteria bacterium]|nr:ethanolamine utilization protein EutJ [Deltaproteobacteria bacterium]
MIHAVRKVKEILNRPAQWDFSDAQTLYAGVDIGTYKTIAIVVDEKGEPRAAALRRAEVVRSGLILDYVGALNLVRELMEEIRRHCPKPIEKGATSYPPQTESGNIETTKYILEGAELDVLKILDEPSAANLVLGIKNGAIVDVGGGTTGIAVIKNGKVVRTSDEATGGVHLSLVLAGHLRVSLEEAEKIKTNRDMNNSVLPVVRPVIEKISGIVESSLKDFRGMKRVCMVGGTCELAGLAGIVGSNLGLEAFQPEAPQVITPLGIALSCLGGNGDNPVLGTSADG